MYALTHLDALEAEAIDIMREVAASFERPCMMYSIGKDSTVMLHLARKAFYPGPVPFPLLHIDTTWEFAEMAQFRDYLIDKHALNVIVHINHEALEQGVHPVLSGSVKYNDFMKTRALKDALDTHRFDAALGGGRRDEEASRAKERIFSIRERNHVWDPKNQRPELWGLYNTELNPGQTARVFPLSNWTEADIWQYIHREKIEIVDLYFSKERESWINPETGQVFALDDERMLPHLSEEEKASVARRRIRFRTLGCYPQTAGVFSEAVSPADIVIEVLQSRQSEREGRLIDKDQAGSMEKKKREGYF